MKRLLTSLFLLTALMGSTWGASLLYFDYPTIDIPISADPVTNEDQPVEFHQPLRWLWDENDPNTLWTITDEQEVSDFTWSVHTTGDMKISGDNNGHTVLWQSSDGKDYQLSSGTFYYRGTSGSITLTAVNPDFLGVAYSASYTIYFRMGIEVKKWDFNSTQYTITGSGWDGAVSHMNTTQGSTSPEYHKCSKPDGYNGDGGSLVTEAAGLTFNIPANTNNGNQVYFGGNNPDGTVPAENRFICFYNGASFTIPASYFDGVANPRIRIKTDRYGGDAIGLEITNGKDALGTKIEDTYFIGGSQWRGDKGDNNFRGEYHFQLTDPTQPFTVKVVSGQWLMLLSVEVYNSEDIISENTMLGSNFQLLNRYDSDNAVAGTYYLHYYGRGERTTLTTHQTTNGDYYWPTGTVTCTNSSFTCTDGLNHTYTSTKGEVGNFNIRIEVRTRDDGQKYCTDYATRSVAVGYLNKKIYPYTWDFTDVAEFEGGEGRMGSQTNNNGNYGETDYSNGTQWGKRHHWENINGTYGHRLSKEAGNYNALYCSGSQLWYGRTIIPELEGLGFTPSNIDGSYNNSLQILTGTTGIKIHQDIRDWWVYRIAIPQVPANGAVYVRVHPENINSSFFHAGYSYGDYIKPKDSDPGNLEIPFSSIGGNNQSVTINTTDGTGDVIYVIPGSAKSASDNITLYFNDVTIKKIAVSTDPKRVNVKGWASESRDHVIDPELTGYMTGSKLQTFIVNQQTYGDNVVLTRVDAPINNTSYVLDAVPTVNGQFTDNNAAYLIYNNSGYVDVDQPNENLIESNKVEILNGGFHLFVPDMHDYGSTNDKKALLSTAGFNNQLKSAITAGTIVAAEDNTHYNYALSYWKYHNGVETPTKEAFYRIYDGGIASAGNQAYLPVLKTATSALKINLSFEDENSETEGIGESLTISRQPEDNVYHNLNGQKLNGTPTNRGIYILNGKKVIVK